MKLSTFRFALYFALALALTGCSGSSKKISVAISGATSTIAPDGTFNLSAAVANDSSGQGVTWTSTDEGLSNETSTTALYSAPSEVPENPSVTVTATSVADPTKSASATFTITASTTTACQPSPSARGNESALTAPITFIVKGSDSDDVPVAYAGSFTANGEGGLTAGTADVVGFDAGAGNLSVDLNNSSYSYGTDGRGCLYLVFDEGTSLKKSPKPSSKRFANKKQGNNANRALGHIRKGQSQTARTKVKPQDLTAPSSLVLAFAMSSPTGPGRVIEFDDATGSGTISAGQMFAQNSEAFGTGLSANFAFGVDGWVADEGLERLAIAGAFKNTAGVLSLGVADDNLGGTPSGGLTGGSGTLDGTVDSTTGRGTGSYTTSGGEGFQFDFVYYIVDGGDILLLSSDDPNDTDVSLGGRALASNAASTALNGYYMFAFSGLDCSTCATDAGNNFVAIGTLHATSALAASGNITANDAGGVEQDPYSGSYTLDTTTGRASLDAIPGAPVAYLTSGGSQDEIVAFLVGTDAFASSGFVATQTLSTPDFDNSSFSGNYAFGSTEDVVGITGGLVGQFVLDGDGNYSGTLDEDVVGQGLEPDTAIGPGTYEVNADGSGDFDDGNEFFVTNGVLSVAVDGANGNQPFLYVFIQQSTPDAKTKKPIVQAAKSSTARTVGKPWHQSTKAKSAQATVKAKR